MSEKMPGTKMTRPNARQIMKMKNAAQVAALKRRWEAQKAFRHHQENCQGKGNGGPVCVSSNGAVYTFKAKKLTW